MRFVYVKDEMFFDLNKKFESVCVIIDGDMMILRCAPVWVFLAVLEKLVLEEVIRRGVGSALPLFMLPIRGWFARESN